VTAATLGAGPVAVVIVRDGILPAGASEAVEAAAHRALVVGSGARTAAAELPAGEGCWWTETSGQFSPAVLAGQLAALLAATPLVVLPGSPDGRDLAPRLADRLDRPLLAAATAIALHGEDDSLTIDAELLRMDGRQTLPARCREPAVATLVPPGHRHEQGPAAACQPLEVSLPTVEALADPTLIAIQEPRPETMDLADATRIFGGGAGLVSSGTDDRSAAAIFDRLRAVATALGAAAGATRVVTDAGWLPYDRQIGTTGVSVQPELYVAFGVSGASQHTGGLGAPAHIVSVNTDPSCPMTARADLGLITDASSLLAELARRYGVADD
jgi:electron transfer flavoprotein alpha subunit